MDRVEVPRRCSDVEDTIVPRGVGHRRHSSCSSHSSRRSSHSNHRDRKYLDGRLGGHKHTSELTRRLNRHSQGMPAAVQRARG